MKRVLLSDFYPPALGGVVAIAAALVLRGIAGTRLLAELLLDATLGVVPGQDFSSLLGVFGPYGKALFFLSALVAQWVLYIAVWARLKREIGPGRERAGELALAAWLAMMAIITSISVAVIALTRAGLGSETSWFEYALAVTMLSLLYAGVAGGQSLGASATGLDALSVDEPATDPGRRRFLGLVPGLALGGLAVVVIARTLRETAGGGVQRSTRGRPTPPVTPTDEFYVISKNLIDPRVDVSKWSLHIGGLVDRPLELRYEQLRAFPAQQQYTTMQCISNYVGDELISNALWRGVPLARVLDDAARQAAASWVLFRCADGYTETLPLDYALKDNVLLAHEMNGEPLTDKHGFPVRLLAPGKYGVKHPKWITDIMLLDEEVLGFWQKQGWSQEARMNTSVRIDVPGDGSDISSAPLLVEGLAFSGDRGIQRVEVSTDGGAKWNDATLTPPLGPYTWVLWQYHWTLEPTLRGRVTLVARATDGEGALQTEREAEPFPSGATGYHRVEVDVKEPRAEES